MLTELLVWDRDLLEKKVQSNGHYSNGYLRIYVGLFHPRNKRGYINKHIAIAELAYGGTLPDGAEVHHIDGDSRNNANSNLVICEDHGYHMLMHQRQRIVDAGGNPDTQKLCPRCGLTDRSEFNASQIEGDGYYPTCRKCNSTYCKQRRASLSQSL